MQHFTKAEIRQINDLFDDLIKSISPKFEEKRLEEVKKAFQFANAAHDGIKRKSGEPYIIHPIAVAKIVAHDLGLGITSIVSSILHDVVEDTEYTVSDIKNMFGKKVAVIVDGLTKLSGDFDTRQVMTLKKVFMTLSDDVRVVLIKIADRLHNMRTLESLQPHKQLRVSSETLYLYAPLAHRLGLNKIKNELEDLSLKYKHPEEYNQIQFRLHDQEKKINVLVDKLIKPIKEKLEQENLQFTINGRVKSKFSIWRKMQKQGVTFDEVYDILAIRIIIQSKPEHSEKRQCFDILSLITDIYKPKPDRIRDWITIPKANGYESLHVTVMGPQGKWVEVQIRTERMDQIAEYGFAAHYKYKGISSQESELEKWLEQVRELLQNTDEDAYEFLDDLKLNLYASEIIVFTPKGDMITLPKNSTIIDFAYEIHTALGNKCIGAKINLDLKPISYVLQNGDQVEILTSENQKPQFDWLKFASSAKAQTKIKAAFKLEKKEHILKGKEIVEQAIKDKHVTVSSNNLKKIIAHYNLNNKEQLYSQVGIGLIELKDLSQILRKKSENKLVKYWNITFNRTKKDADDESSLVKIDKKKTFLLKEEQDAINFSLAQCCNPIPGDNVVGYLSTEDHVYIHKRECTEVEKLLSSKSEKIISAEWTKFKKLSYLTKITMDGFDRLGIVNEVTNVISKLHNVNMRSVKFETHDGIFEGELFLYIHNIEDLINVIAKLEKIKGINKVLRDENISE